MAELIERALPPIDEDPRAFFDFFRAFTSAPEPLGFLAERGLDEAELCRVLGAWQEKLARDASTQKEVLAILRDPPGPAPAVRPEKPGARASARLDATSLGFVVARPALPFVAPSPGERLPALPPAPPRAPPSGLGETRLAFRVDRPALPFERAPRPPSVPPKAPSPPRSLAETAPAMLLDKPALPFARASAASPLAFASPKAPPPPRPLGETKPAFQVYNPAALPFPGAPLAVTAPVFRLDKLDLPFVKGAAAPPAPKAPLPAPLPPAAGGLGETSLAVAVDLSAVLPFAKRNTPSTRLTIEVYASMCAEIWLAPGSALAIIARHGLSPEAKRAEDAAWQARFSASPEEKASWERLAIEAGNRIRAGR